MAWNKPLPQPTPISQPYWDALQAHEVHIQQCADCGQWIFFPRAHCPACASQKLTWRKITGNGTLVSYTVTHVPTLPEFTDEMPQLLAVVQLDEGPHLNTTLVGAKPDTLKIGQRLRPVFDDRPGSVTLLRYAPVESSIANVIESAADAAPASMPDTAKAEHAVRRVSCKDIDALQGLISDKFSAWSNELTVSQELINQFAELSGDDYWIHTDPERAKAQSPFGTTIAQGSLVQVLVSKLKQQFDYEITDYHNMVNYGSDRLRFMAPVPAGCKIHARSRVKAVEAARSGAKVTFEMNVHVVGMDKPSVVNDLVVLYM